ncbi:hypothetical protein SEA_PHRAPPUCCINO_180 [Mycobacterium phage Phrappuccino]|uniref:Uncharacterized protein n=1 Tax=Mycobacterium phage Phrappuccino TaxID=2591223 RepID=A0A514DE16_9CAUD|nr:hypothetical protein KHQ87_gp180 [Mycobacterium phage Phrappuccino]QDH91855.1 hypothetical protein SEA_PHRAPPUCCINO_180 [Mycobacterium phage Phrappuccino]QIQ63296.1 hypothetical protein SEA_SETTECANDELA_180 [Mycobacterium phage Settecandela]
MSIGEEVAMLDIVTGEPTDAGYDAADAIELWLENHPGKHTPSRIARGVHIDTSQARAILCWLDEHVYVAATGNGCWRRYGARR